MTTKIFVSQIDTTQPDGTTADPNSVLLLSETGPIWYQVAGLSGTGYRGSKGYDGSIGYTGSIGYRGSKGEDGVVGGIGYKGSVGYQGSAGNGFAGSAGYFGSIGYRGSVGYFGSAGGAGYQGSIGLTGFTGSTGNLGYFGSTGYFGSIGYQGSSGATGALDPFPFLNLSDVPYDTYNDYAGAYLRVNNERDGIRFDTVEVLTTNITSNIEVNGNEVIEPTFKGYSELVNDVGNSGASPSWSLLDGNVITTVLNQPVVTVTLDATGLTAGRLYSVTLFLKQDATGGRVIDWTNQTVYWSTGDGIDQANGPVLSGEANYTDIVTFYTFDGGTTWYGVMGAKGFPTT
jgi:hypothetical protein